MQLIKTKQTGKLIFLSLFLPFCALAQEKARFSWEHLPTIEQPSFGKDTFSIAAYGAVPDGTTLNTESITRAIADCSKKGGVVLVPAGLWVTGPIALKSNVNLHLRSGATLLFTEDKTKFKIVEGSYEGKSAARNESPISGSGLQNIAITGKGIIDGNGDVWRALNRNQVNESHWKHKIASGGVLSEDGKSWYPSQQFKDAVTGKKSMLLVPGKAVSDFADMKDFLRPNLLSLVGCKKVLLQGVTFQNSAAWCIHPLLCEDLTMRDLTVKNPEYAQNGDGMDIESCKNFLVEGCSLSVGDDGICIKSGKDEEGRKRGKPTENGIIRNNTVYEAHGGFVIGSEMSGGARYIFVENCTFIGTDKGLRFKSVRGRGGIVEHIHARNIFMKDIVSEAIFFDLFYFVKFATDGERDMSPVVSEATPIFRNMVFENIVCHGAKKGIFMRGLSEMPISNIRIMNSVLNTNIGVELTDVENVDIQNVQLNAASPAPLIMVDNVKSVTFNALTYPAATSPFLQAKGERTERITIMKSGIPKGSDKVVRDKEVAAEVIGYIN